LTDSERIRLARLGKQLGLNAVKDVAAIVKPETIVTWYRRLIAKTSTDWPSAEGVDAIECKQCLGGMPKYYYREAA
jgi:hypothetical protein